MKIKKHLLIVSMLAVMMSLAGCAQDADDSFEYDEAELAYETMTLFEKYSAVEGDFVDYYLDAGTDFEQSAVKGIDQARNNDKVGDFESYNKYLLNYDKTTFNPESVDAEFVEDDGAVTVTIINSAKNRDVEISVKYTENPEYYIAYSEYAEEITADELTNYIESYLNVTVEEVLEAYGYTSIDELVESEITGYLEQDGVDKYIAEEMVVSAVYSKGELMKQAGMNTLIGMGTVFVVLIFISFIISLFKYLPALTAKKAKMPEPKPVVKPVAPVAAPKKQEDNLMNDAELVAVITAAINAASESDGSLAVSKDRLVVKSIKRVKK